MSQNDAAAIVLAVFVLVVVVLAIRELVAGYVRGRRVLEQADAETARDDKHWAAVERVLADPGPCEWCPDSDVPPQVTAASCACVVPCGQPWCRPLSRFTRRPS